jgi:hypothetical protein
MSWQFSWLGLVLAVGCAKAPEEVKPPAEVKAQEQAQGSGREEPFVADILREMHRTYENLQWYADEGEVITQHSEHRGRTPPEKILRFRTHFVRPDHLHFEFEAEPWPTGMHRSHKWTLWWTGEQATTWWTMPRELRQRPLKDAISAGTGISDRSAYSVPSILLPELGGPAWGNPRLVGREEKFGRECFVIDFRQTVGRPVDPAFLVLTRVWLEMDTYLVRRIREEMRPAKPPHRPVHWVTVTRYWPDLETKPPEDVFRPKRPDPTTDPTVPRGEVTMRCCNSCDIDTCSDCRDDIPHSLCTPPRVQVYCVGEGDQRTCLPRRTRPGR